MSWMVNSTDTRLPARHHASLLQLWGFEVCRHALLTHNEAEASMCALPGESWPDCTQHS